jgi:organic radical activating enzyme
MNKFNGIDHKIQRLYIHWDITTKCNYDCNYCYAKFQYGNDWQKEENYKNIKIILNSIKLSSLPVFLGILGGEPTSSKYYEEIINNISKNILPRNKDNRLYITTNLSKNLEYWKKHPKIKNTFILASFHPEHNQTENDLKIFIEKLKYLKQYFKVKVNIMLDPKFENINKLWLTYLPELVKSNIIIHPHIIYPNGSPFNNLKDIYNNELKSNPFYKEIYSFMEPEYIDDDNNKYTDIDLFSTGKNKFTGWNCYQNNYEINLNGKVNNMCSDNISNLIQNPMYFKNLKKVKSIICKADYCNCDGLLKCKKTREG